MKEAIENLKAKAIELHEAPLWKQLKPGPEQQYASEYINQARVDLLRCKANLERAEKLIREG